MDMFYFLSDSGKKLLGKGDASVAIKKEIEDSFTRVPVVHLMVKVTDDTVALAGVTNYIESREKVILIAGNIEGISNVNAEQLVCLEIIEKTHISDIPRTVFYNIQKGETLWKIAIDFYKDGSKYPLILEANLEVIKGADEIYPGQSIRIPSLIL